MTSSPSSTPPSLAATGRPTLRCGDRVFALGTRTFVMGIVNVTPDSFSDGGAFASTDAAVDHAVALFDAGADVIDIGGESTRPGAAPVDAATERARVLPVIEGLARRGHRAISVDTRHADVARAAVEAGAAWVNDVSALDDDDMIAACAGADALVLMHWHRAAPAAVSAVDDAVDDDDVTATVIRHLQTRLARAVAGGMAADRVLVDPGIGFGKTVAHNLALTRALGRITAETGAAGVLYGPSRKRFLGAITGREAARDRDAATLGAISVAVVCGADVVRVHDVRAAADAVAVADAIVRGAGAARQASGEMWPKI